MNNLKDWIEVGVIPDGRITIDIFTNHANLKTKIEDCIEIVKNNRFGILLSRQEAKDLIKELEYYLSCKEED